MSTRKLILTALFCGLAIMVAGGLKLFQVARNDSRVEVLSFGETSRIADMTVSVVGISQKETATYVTVTMSGVEGADASEGWRVLAGGEVLAPIVGDDPAPGSNLCVRTMLNSPVSCDVVFPATTGTITVAYLRGGAQSQWAP